MMESPKFILEDQFVGMKNFIIGKQTRQPKIKTPGEEIEFAMCRIYSISEELEAEHDGRADENRAQMEQDLDDEQPLVYKYHKNGEEKVKNESEDEVPPMILEQFDEMFETTEPIGLRATAYEYFKNAGNTLKKGMTNLIPEIKVQHHFDSELVTEFRESKDKVLNVVGDLSDMAKDFKNKQLPEKAEAVIKKMDNFMDKGVDEMEIIKNIAKSFFQNYGAITENVLDAIIHIVVSCINIWRIKEHRAVIFVQAVSGLGVFRISHIAARGIMMCSDLIVKIGDKIDQSGNGVKAEAKSPGVTGLLDALKSAWEGIQLFFSWFFGIRVKGNLPNFKEVAQGLGAVKTMGQAIQWICEFLYSTYEWGFKKVYGVDPLFRSGDALAQRACQWIEKVSLFEKKFKQEKLANSYDLCNAIIAHWDYATQLEKEIMTQKKNTHIFVPFYNSKKLFEAVYSLAFSFVTTHKSRPEPVFLFLFGEPKQGKSNCAKMIAQDLYNLWREANPDEYEGMDKAASIIFEKKSDSEFYDGYAHQFANFFDDAMQSADQETRRKFLMDVIQMGNSSAYPLNMANLNQKGTTFFTSKLMLATSNVMHTQKTSII